MFIAIVENQSGEVQLLRQLSPTESIDPAAHVAKWAESMGVTVATPDGYIPSGCGDYYAETRDTKAPTGVCWSSLDFYLEHTE